MALPESLRSIVDDLAAAARAKDSEGFFAAGQRLADAFDEATRQDLDAAVALLVPVLADAPQSLGGPLAEYVGSLVGMDGDVAPVLDVLVERACRALEGTRQFVVLYEELVGPVPERAACGAREYEAFAEAAAGRIDAPGAVARSWMYSESWVQPVLYLAQRADVRRTLPQRERLTAAAIAAEDDLPDYAPWLLGLLRILDDEPLVVLHRPTGATFRVTISGVADNFQLHTLLAAHLIPLLPVVRRGVLRRRDSSAVPAAPTPAMLAAADGSGDLAPAGGITGQFNLVDGTGAWIWNEGRPDEIARVDGVRVVVLDPAPYERGWNSGRAYPLLSASAEVAPLSDDEASTWLSRIAPAKPVDQATDDIGWTDDLSMGLPEGGDVAGLVNFTLATNERGVSGDELEAAVAREFSLSAEDAALAVDRVFGGITRAATLNEANRPDPVKDPIAFESYRQALERNPPTPGSQG
ncbi:hypothetical protein [Kribbella albertanoniae]|uniref:Uncharacterized protein n=1 Tax=Kribbella albertanoniae TaxID=1266829 RepID=A0A4R4PY07_9ACTN|nr:hypothetical protein [Kribbella albertanoniae]TDC27362.1 hypothetical protein E1261_20865 [Kribbella albertanoniae]